MEYEYRNVTEPWALRVCVCGCVWAGGGGGGSRKEQLPMILNFRLSYTTIQLAHLLESGEIRNLSIDIFYKIIDRLKCDKEIENKLKVPM